MKFLMKVLVIMSSQTMAFMVNIFRDCYEPKLMTHMIVKLKTYHNVESRFLWLIEKTQKEE